MRKQRWLVFVLLLFMLSYALAREVEPIWSFPISQELMDDPEGFLVLANAWQRLTKQDVPTDLVAIKTRKTASTAIQLRKIVSTALSDMFAAADRDGVMLYAHSGYRSYNTQDTMYKNRLKQLGYDDKVVQVAGGSDHQTGLGIDVISRAWIGKRLNSGFAPTIEGQWMAEHCAEYGFIIRYPKGKEEITGIIYEPWHLRYVGPEVAQYLMDYELTLEEFWEEWMVYQIDE